MWIAKDWANSATPAKSRTLKSKLGIKQPAQQFEHPPIQMSFCKTKGGFVLSEAPLLSSSSRNAWSKPNRKQAEGEDASSMQQQLDKQQQQPGDPLVPQPEKRPEQQDS